MIDQFGRFIPDNQYFGRMPQRQEIVHVNGRGGAEAFQMAANSSALLLDDTASIVWLKTTDGAGFPTLTPYTVTPYQPEPQISTAELLDRITRLEEIVNGKPDSGNATAPEPVRRK